MEDVQRIEKLSALHRDLIRKNKEFTDAMNERAAFPQLEVIHNEIKSIYAEILTLRSEREEPKN